MFRNVDAYAGDPILTLMETYKQDPRPDRVNLSIGLYYNEQAIIPQLQAVGEAQAMLLARATSSSSSYLPMEGLPTYRSATQALLFGEDHPMRNGVAYRHNSNRGRLWGVESRCGLSQKLFPGFAGLGQRPDLGKPCGDFLRRRIPGEPVPLFRQ